MLTSTKTHLYLHGNYIPTYVKMAWEALYNNLEFYNMGTIDKSN